MTDISERPRSDPSIRTTWRALRKWASQPAGEDETTGHRLPLWVSRDGVAGQPSAASPHAEAIQRVLARYASLLGVRFSFRTGAGRYSPAAPPDAVHVHSFALPTPAVFFGIWPRAPLAPLLFAYGVPLREGSQWALLPGSHLGRGHFLTDEEGNVVAEYRGTNLYCLFDLLAQQPTWVPLLLRRHLDLGLPWALSGLAPATPGQPWKEALRLLREETAAEVRGGRRRLHDLARNAYIEACREGVVEEIRFLQADIAFLEAGVEEMGRRIATDTRRLIEGRRRLASFQGEAEPPEAPADLSALRALPEVREVRRRPGCITILTHPILVEHEGRHYRLGSFQVDLHDDGDVWIGNLSNRLGLFDHPHVCQGRPRLAGIREGVAKLLGESQIVAATEVLIDFLKTVDPTDWRLPIQSWPEAGRETERAIPASA